MKKSRLKISKLMLIFRGFEEMNKKPTKWGWYNAGEIPGPADCPLQTDVLEDINESGEQRFLK